MASNAEMRRLILHAADRIANEEAGVPEVYARLICLPHGTEARTDYTRELAGLTAALALAEQTLRMVAACLADDEPDGRHP